MGETVYGWYLNHGFYTKKKVMNYKRNCGFFFTQISEENIVEIVKCNVKNSHLKVLNLSVLLCTL